MNRKVNYVLMMVLFISLTGSPLAHAAGAREWANEMMQRAREAIADAKAKMMDAKAKNDDNKAKIEEAQAKARDAHDAAVRQQQIAQESQRRIDDLNHITRDRIADLRSRTRR